ncbi:MAG: Rpn family recombination-promoting nuclease/putative transposase [Chitinophagaceae bacterium]|nr:Rpn family recombination-promoting nuclease/putative transposase [Chitinophagaceae bacterium]
MKAKYIDPFTDFGFKKIFGEEASKPLLMDFLNALLPNEDKIMDLTLKNTEQLGHGFVDRKSIYDIYCENEKGEKFIVEIQKAKQNYFKERTIYYSTFPIREQAEKGGWNFDLKAIYCIGVLDFTFNDYKTESEKKEVVHTIQLKNQNGKIFYDKLTFIYLEVPNFKKTETELTTRLDKWLYFIKNLEDFQNIPTIIGDDIFSQAFEKASLAKFGEKDIYDYEISLKSYRDYYNTIDYAFGEGEAIGIQKGELKKAVESGLGMLDEGFSYLSIQKILKFTDTQMQILVDSWKNKLSVLEIINALNTQKNFQ